MGAKNILPSETAAVVATIDPDAYAPGAQNSDYVDMADFESLMAVLMIGTFADTGTTADFKLQQATTSGGAGVKDITGKAITQIASGSPAAGDKQAMINLRADELDLANDFQFVRAVATVADTSSPADSPAKTSDYGAILLGFGPRYGPASDNDLASVVEITT
jgi:hypothetical protein